ncbi:MAG: thiamine diphosphokinase [Bacteroidota bacterium]|jgi:thiamine pyrophosphokinase
MKRALILANGKPPGKKLLQKFLASADLFICADGGANIAARFGCAPNLIIGDLDSIEKETLSVFSNVDVKKLNDQNSTDLEKALTATVRKKYKEIVVLGATGGRLDHAIGNLSALAKFSRKAHITFVDNMGKFIAINHSLEFNLPIGTIISLLPLSRCSGIVTKGLKWNLRNESLELGVRESTSNVIVSFPANIKVKKGNLIAFIAINI